MGITVREALTIPPLNKAIVIAGASGLERTIKVLGVTDVPDFSDWVRGNELILTTGYFMNPSLNLCDIIRKADAKGAAGIGIKFKRYINDINDDVIGLANELGFPILSMPFEHRWVDYFNTVFTTIMDKNTAEIGYSKKMLEDFTEVVLAGGGFDSIVQTAGAILNRPCGLFDIRGNLISYVGQHPEFWNEVNSTYHSCLEHNKLFEGIYTCNVNIFNSEFFQMVSNIKTGNEYFGNFFVISKQNFSNYDLIILRQVLTVSCIEFQKRKAVEAVERNYKESFLNDLIRGLFLDKSVIESKLDFYGLKISKGGTVVVIDFPSKSKMVDTANQHVSNLRYLFDTNFGFKNPISTYLADQVVMIIPAGYSIVKTVDKVADILKKNLPEAEFKIAIGRDINDISKIYQSYKDARNILKIADICDKDILDYKNLGLIRLLIDKIDKESLKEFFLDYLGPILKYQRENNIDLLNTLAVYYHENCNIRNTGKRLFIHYNTVRYRLNLIKDISKLDIDNVDIKTTLSIALKIKTVIE